MTAILDGSENAHNRKFPEKVAFVKHVRRKGHLKFHSLQPLHHCACHDLGKHCAMTVDSESGSLSSPGRNRSPHENSRWQRGERCCMVEASAQCDNIELCRVRILDQSTTTLKLVPLCTRMELQDKGGTLPLLQLFGFRLMASPRVADRRQNL